MKVRTFNTRLMQLNDYHPCFPPDCVGQMVTALPDDEVKEILYHAMPNLWRKKMTEQEYNYLDRSIQEISGFFETRIDNLETPAPPPAIRSLTRKRKRKFQETESCLHWGFWQRFLRHWITPKPEESLSVSWKVQSFYGRMYYTQGPN